MSQMTSTWSLSSCRIHGYTSESLLTTRFPNIATHSMIIAIGPPASDKVATILAGEDPPAFARDNVTPWLRQWGSQIVDSARASPLSGRAQNSIVRCRRLFWAQVTGKAQLCWESLGRRWSCQGAGQSLWGFSYPLSGASHWSHPDVFLKSANRPVQNFSQGDIAYAIMGLFPNSHRPSIDKQDSGFQA